MWDDTSFPLAVCPSLLTLQCTNTRHTHLYLEYNLSTGQMSRQRDVFGTYWPLVPHVPVSSSSGGISRDTELLPGKGNVVTP